MTMKNKSLESFNFKKIAYLQVYTIKKLSTRPVLEVWRLRLQVGGAGMTQQYHRCQFFLSDDH